VVEREHHLQSGQQSPFRLSRAETKQLWWFLDGGIMHAGARWELHHTWGLCSRHAWGLAIVECETRGGDVPVTSLLYEDLLRHAARRLCAPRLSERVLRRRLTGSAGCFTCEHIAGGGLAHRGSDVLGWSDIEQRVNQRNRFHDLVRSSRPSGWRTCPACCGGTGIMCRKHLIAGEPAPDQLTTQLGELADRLWTLRHSMTVEGSPSDAPERDSWVETIAWFTGWDRAERVLSEARESREHPQTE
jgi:hypothetical protein